MLRPQCIKKNLDTANNSISQATFRFIDPVSRLFEMSSFLDVTPNQKPNREVHFEQFELVRFLWEHCGLEHTGVSHFNAAAPV